MIDQPKPSNFNYARYVMSGRVAGLVIRPAGSARCGRPAGVLFTPLLKTV